MRPITAKSGRIVVTSPEDFASHASKQVESVTTLYLPTKEILPEPASVSDAPYIKGTLDVHRIVRRKNIQGVIIWSFIGCLQTKFLSSHNIIETTMILLFAGTNHLMMALINVLIASLFIINGKSGWNVQFVCNGIVLNHIFPCK